METEKQIPASDWWKVLKGPISLPDAFRIIGISEEKIEKRLEDYKEPGGTMYTYFGDHLVLGRIAYDHLVNLGEISDQEIYFAGDTPRHADLGFKGKET